MHLPEADCDSVCRLIIAIFAGIYLTVALILAIYFLRDSKFEGPKMCSGFCAFVVSFTLSLLMLPLFVVYLLACSPVMLVDYVHRKRLERDNHIHPDSDTEQAMTDTAATAAGNTKSPDAKNTGNTYVAESYEAKGGESEDDVQSKRDGVDGNKMDGTKEKESDDREEKKSDDAKEGGMRECQNGETVGARNPHTESSGFTLDDSPTAGLTSVASV